MEQKIIKTLLKKYHNSNLPLDDKEIDTILGIDYKEDEKKIDRHKLAEEYGYEQFQYEGTPYDFIRFFLNKLSLRPSDVVYDLGSGYGRILLYGAITKESLFKGIEIVASRVQKVNERKRIFNLENLDCKEYNILNADYSDGNIFFLFNPFFYETLEKVGQKLKDISKDKQIKIVTWGGTSNDYFEDQDWLSNNPNSNKQYSKIQFFESKPIYTKN